AAPTEHESGSAAAAAASARTAGKPSSRSAARSTRSAGTTLAAGAKSWRSKARREDAGRWIEFSGIDRAQSIVHQSTIDIGRTAGAAHRDRIAPGAVERKPWRQQRRDFARHETRRLLRLRLSTVAALHAQRLEALSTASGGRRRHRARRRAAPAQW